MKRIWIPEAPLLNLHRYNAVEGLTQKFGVRGYFTVELVHKASGLIARRLHFKNLIVDAGLNSFPTMNLSDYTYAAVGTGSTAPANGQTALVTELARTNFDGGFGNASVGSIGVGYGGMQRTRVFTTAQANGNLTEVGMFTASSGGTMFCRQLLKDDLGAPTTIVKTSDYELRIIYEFRLYYTPGDVVYSATINGAPMNVTQRVGRQWIGTQSYQSSVDFASQQTPASSGGTTGDYGVYTTAMGSAGDGPTGTRVTPTSNVEDAYVPGTFQRSATWEWNASNANQENLTIVLPMARHQTNGTGYWQYQHQLAAALNKTNTQKMVLVWNRTWNRV